MTHFKITQAFLISLFTTIVGFVVAFVPNLGPDKEILIAAGTTAIALGFLVANAIHALIATKLHLDLASLEQGVRKIAQEELGKVDLNTVVSDALKGENLGALIQNEFKQVLTQAANGVTPLAGAVTPLAEAPPVPPAA